MLKKFGKSKRNKKATVAYTELPKSYLDMTPEEQLDFCGNLLQSLNPLDDEKKADK